MFVPRDDSLQTVFQTPLDYGSEAFIPDIHWERGYFPDQSPNNSPISVQNQHQSQFQHDFVPETLFERTPNRFEYYSDPTRSPLKNPVYVSESSCFPSHVEPNFDWYRESDGIRLNRRPYNRCEEYVSSQEYSQMKNTRRSSNNQRNEEISFSKENHLDTPESLYKKNYSFIEEDTSYISNLSTQESECLRDWSQEIYVGKSNKKSDSNENINGDHFVLAEVAIENDHGCETLVIYNDANIEALLNNACVKNHIKGRMGLCFKINVLKMILDLHPQEEKIAVLLDKLLEANYALVMNEIHKESSEDNYSIYRTHYDIQEMKSSLRNF